MVYPAGNLLRDLLLFLYFKYACLFKGKKPLAILYPNGTEVEAHTWKQVASQLMRGCAEDKLMAEKLGISAVKSLTEIELSLENGKRNGCAFKDPG